MNNIQLQPNTACYYIDYADAFAKTVNKNDGVYKLAKLVENILKVSKEIFISFGNSLYVPQLSKTITHFNSCCKALIVNKITSSAVSFKRTFDKSEGISEKLVYDALELTCDILTITGHLGVLKLAVVPQFLSLINRVADTKNHLGKYVENDCAKMEEFNKECEEYEISQRPESSQSSPRFLRPLIDRVSFLSQDPQASVSVRVHPVMEKEVPDEIRKIAMVKIVKDIISVALTTFSLISLFLGISVISSTTVLALSTFAIVCSLASSVASETTSHKMALLHAQG